MGSYTPIDPDSYHPNLLAESCRAKTLSHTPLPRQNPVVLESYRTAGFKYIGSGSGWSIAGFASAKILNPSASGVCPPMY